MNDFAQQIEAAYTALAYKIQPTKELHGIKSTLLVSQ